MVSVHQRHGLGQARLADGGIVAPDAFVDGGEIDVVKARARPDAQAELGHRRQRHLGVHIAVDHGGRAEGQGLERA
jgi:hypothetical protein